MVTNPIDLETAYEQSDQCKKVKEEVTGIMEDLTSREKTNGRVASASVTYATNFFWQVSTVYINH